MTIIDLDREDVFPSSSKSSSHHIQSNSSTNIVEENNTKNGLGNLFLLLLKVFACIMGIGLVFCFGLICIDKIKRIKQEKEEQKAKALEQEKEEKKLIRIV
jgi:uncharacterized protein HemX